MKGIGRDSLGSLLDEFDTKSARRLAVSVLLIHITPSFFLNKRMPTLAVYDGPFV